MKRRKKKRIRLLGLLLAAVCLFFGSCAQKKYAEGYSCSEIAEMLGTKESTVRSYLRRGREKLKNYLGGNSDEK